jgi:hypothetical protein
VIGTPRAATNLTVVAPVHATILDGEPAATVSYSYDYNGTANRQTDVVSRYSDMIEYIEMDAEPALGSQAANAMSTTVSHWHWR